MADWNLTLFTLGGSPVSVSTVLGVLLSTLLLLVAARWMRRRLMVWLLARTPLDGGTRLTIAALAHYLVLVVGIAVVMQNAGLKLSAFGILAGAIGVGLGFGLQNIVSNFISGLIVMFERPVRIGDRIEIGGIEGDVVAINARSTVLRTSKGTAAIVPNQRFITEYVRNLTLRDGTTVLPLVLKLAAGQDAAVFERVLLEATQSIAAFLSEREPAVQCIGIDAAGASYELQIWVRGDAMQRAQLLSVLLNQIRERLQGSGIRLI